MKVSQNVTELWRVPECLKKSKGHNLETKSGEGQSFLYATRRPDLVHIAINLHENILNGNRVTACTKMFKAIRMDRTDSAML